MKGWIIDRETNETICQSWVSLRTLYGIIKLCVCVCSILNFKISSFFLLAFEYYEIVYFYSQTLIFYNVICSFFLYLFSCFVSVYLFLVLHFKWKLSNDSSIHFSYLKPVFWWLYIFPIFFLWFSLLEPKIVSEKFCLSKSV